MDSIERYGVFELVLDNVQAGKTVEYGAEFEHEGEKVTVPAFWAKDKYLVRFMPMKTGVWRYRVTLGGQAREGMFTCVENTGPNHGPVLTEGYHFRYADGSRYLPFGTTCYAWTHQTEDLQNQTLETLAGAPFNKLRMCVFPKSMPYNNNDPAYYPFHRDAQGNWDVQNPDERYWQNLENRIIQLAAMGIEADLILFHPYDRWGFAEMGRERDLAYLEYAVARLAAYRNVWWSLANEYDLVVDKDYEDWDAFGERIAARDPYHHLISNHNCLPIYPKRDWMTHCSIQSGDINNIPLWQQQYGLPVLIDECGYEGNIEYGWGNLSAFEMVHRFWWTMARGGYCTHGETFHREDEVLWWAKGGLLHGESPRRIAFLRQVMEGIPEAMEPKTEFMGYDPNGNQDTSAESTLPNGFSRGMSRLSEDARSRLILSLLPLMLHSEEHQLVYYGHGCPAFANLKLPQRGRYRVEVLDAWEMTRAKVLEGVCGDQRIDLPGHEGAAVLVTRLEGEPLR